MKKDTQITNRKVEHIRICLEEDVNSTISTGFEKFRFAHQALPELNLNEIDCTTTIFGKNINAPILISSMTGGAAEAVAYNEIFARLAQEFSIALALGSQRAAISNPELASTYQVRKIAPQIPVFANLGAIQLNYGYTILEYQKAVDMIEADALILHLNPLQEAIQPEGDTNWKNLLPKIETLCKSISVPVIGKEVGWGISVNCARRLLSAGVAAIDVAGAGGLSWSAIEKHRANHALMVSIADHFNAWGIPTADALSAIHASLPDALLFASGGLKNGIDLAKSMALGAKLGGFANVFLHAAHAGEDQLRSLIQQIIKELKICMFLTGSENLSALNTKKLEKIA